MSVHAIRPRKPTLHFDSRVPRWWLYENPVLTHVANGLHLVFPAGERFFIRSVKHYADQIQDPLLVQRIRGFYAQESRHGQEHTRSFEMMREQGYDVARFLELYERRLPQIEELLSPALRLSVTVALEHLTATLGESALCDEFLDHAHPEMARLLRWHACEEIEHKSVAFDVYQAVDGRWSVRVAGMALGLGGLMAFWTIASRMLLEQERARGLSPADERRHARHAQETRGGRLAQLFSRAVFDYVRPGFHPDQRDNYGLAEAYLKTLDAVEEQLTPA